MQQHSFHLLLTMMMHLRLPLLLETAFLFSLFIHFPHCIHAISIFASGKAGKTLVPHTPAQESPDDDVTSLLLRGTLPGFPAAHRHTAFKSAETVSRFTTTTKRASECVAFYCPVGWVATAGLCAVMMVGNLYRFFALLTLLLNFSPPATVMPRCPGRSSLVDEGEWLVVG